MTASGVRGEHEIGTEGPIGGPIIPAESTSGPTPCPRGGRGILNGTPRGPQDRSIPE